MNTDLFLPTNLKEAKKRGWDKLDVILITADAYIDHPSFGVAIIGRYLESLGVRIGIIAAPDSHNNEDFLRLGAPSWFFGITSGNLDSMLMLQTAAKKHRSDDDYVPRKFKGRRPKRAVIAYCNKIRELFKGSQILVGGIEASLRRFAHYDYWDNKIRRSILLDARADMLVYGMGEKPLAEVIRAVREGTPLKKIQGISGTATILNKTDSEKIKNGIGINPYDKIKNNKIKYIETSKVIHQNQNPYNARTILQAHGDRYICVYPPSMPLNQKELDDIYALPFTRKPHPAYKKKIPAYEMIKFSVCAMRGCFGGCSFCSLSLHQGAIIQSRSVKSVIAELKKIKKLAGFKGYISDIGGPTANIYNMGCKSLNQKKSCRKMSCVYPRVCPNLNTDHSGLIILLQKARSVSGIKKIFIASGIRFDLANLCPDYIKEIALHHVSGQLKVAPEHSHPDVLSIMQKPSITEYEKFKKIFLNESKRGGLKQFLVAYFMTAHPGCTLDEQISLCKYLIKNKLRPRQVQEFIPLPMTLASDMYYSRIHPITGKKIKVITHPKDRKLQKDLMFYYLPDNEKLLKKIKI